MRYVYIHIYTCGNTALLSHSKLLQGKFLHRDSPTCIYMNVLLTGTNLQENLTMHLKNTTKTGRRECCKSNCTHPNFCSVCENSSNVLGRWQPTPLLCIRHIFPASQSNWWVFYIYMIPQSITMVTVCRGAGWGEMRQQGKLITDIAVLTQHG